MNCAGLYSDEIARMVDKDSKIKIIPRKGEEYILNKKIKEFSTSYYISITNWNYKRNINNSNCR